MQPLPAMPSTPTTHPLLRQQLQFETHTSGSGSPASNNSSHLTPHLQGLKLGRGHGRPRKTPEPPNYDNFPVGASQDVIDQYLKAKKMQKWRYEKLTGAAAAEHRKKENERASRLYHQKNSLQPTAGADSTNNDHEDEERTKELRRIR